MGADVARFLFTSVPIEGHAASPLAIMSRLVAEGHDVTWLAGARHADRAAAAGVRHVAVSRSTDFSLHRDAFDARPELRRLTGVALLKAAFRDVFLADAPAQMSELSDILEDFDADVVVSAGPQFGPALLAERRGLLSAAIGDGPYAPLDEHNPPFGPGLRPWSGPLGRFRNRALNRLVRRMFSDVHQAWVDLREAHGLVGPHPWVFDAMASADLVVQGCVPGFEYARPFPPHVQFVGALRPMAPTSWDPPPWWSELDHGVPVVHVSQGTIRADPSELVTPTIEALADEDVLVVVTAGGIDPAALGPLPANVRVAPFIPYERLLARADVFVTNGGYIGTNLALHHGVPIVQVGATEEKAETGARVAHLGVGHSFKRLPSQRRLRRAILSAMEDRALRARVASLADDYRTHDAPREAAELLVGLARTRRQPAAAATASPRD